MIKAIETYYDGHFFRSRLEARWAVFFNACGVKWEYEAQGYDLGNGIYYLPDFLLHGVVFNHGGYRRDQDLYVEVKGQMTEEDARKIKLFSQERPILVVGEIPKGEDAYSIFEHCDEQSYHAEHDITMYNFETVDDDYFTATPGVDLDGDFNLFGADSTYMDSMDKRATVNAYRKARCARFEHGDQIVNELRQHT